MFGLESTQSLSHKYAPCAGMSPDVTMETQTRSALWSLVLPVMLKNKTKVSASLAAWLAESTSHAYESDFSNLKMALLTSVVLERIQTQAYLNDNPRGSI